MWSNNALLPMKEERGLYSRRIITQKCIWIGVWVRSMKMRWYCSQIYKRWQKR